MFSMAINDLYTYIPPYLSSSHNPLSLQDAQYQNQFGATITTGVGGFHI